MQSSYQSLAKRKKKSPVRQFEELHPYKTVLYLAMIGSGVLFLLLTALYFIFSVDDEVSRAIPRVFIISTMVLMASGYSVSGLSAAFQKEDFVRLRRLLLTTIAGGLIFSALQVVGWYDLAASGILLTGAAADTYLYLITGIHVLHLVAGMGILGYLYFQYRNTGEDPVKKLLVTTNPYERTKLEIAAGFWHFIDIVWICLFFCFLITL